MVGTKTWKEILVKVKYNANAKSINPNVDSGLNVDYAASKRIGFKIRWYLLLTLVIAPVLLAIWILIRPSVLILGSGIITTEPLEIRAYAKGVVSSITVVRGYKLTDGETILTAEEPQLNARINELYRQLREVNQDQLLTNNAILDQLNNSIVVASNGEKKQRAVLKLYESYSKNNAGLVPASDMATVQQAHTTAQMLLENAKTNLLAEQQRQEVELISGIISQSRKNIRLELAGLEALQDQQTIHAPFASQVTDILVQPGELISEGQPLVLLSGREKPVIFTYLEPKYLDYSHLGQQATIILPNGTDLRATVSEPTKLVGSLPKQLSGPFDGEKPVLRITLTPDTDLDINVEGVPVEVKFDHAW